MDQTDGLLRAGEPGVQLTWMDAKLGDWVVTPRIGKPVEINALWYNALRRDGELRQRLGRAMRTAICGSPSRCEAGFGRFVNPANGGLYDVLDGPEGNDATVRPNQILAVSLPETPLRQAQQAGVVALCGRELLTSCGLRSLSPVASGLSRQVPGRCGGARRRLSPGAGLGLAARALRARRIIACMETSKRRSACSTPLRDHLPTPRSANVSEIFDGDAPHTPRGAPCAGLVRRLRPRQPGWRLERAAHGRRRAPSDPNRSRSRTDVERNNPQNAGTFRLEAATPRH